MTLNKAAAAMGGRFSGEDGSRAFIGISTDTRTVPSGALFFALKGPNFDGHDHLVQAADRGVAAAVVSRAVDAPVAQLNVADTLQALGRLARHWRTRFDTRVAAITGSNGKTSVKELLGGIAQAAGETLVTPGNLNNEIGLPLTLAELDRHHEFAVLEMGASAVGEIERLVAIGQPHVAVITLCAPSHIEGFGSIDAVARAKGEIIEGLGPDGVAVINADDAYAPLWRELAGDRRVVGFGTTDAADTRVTTTANGLVSEIELHLLDGVRVNAHLRLPGEHAARNALAAATAAQALGIAPDAIRQGLEAAAPVRGRLRPVPLAGGHLLLDDSYNANPHSLRAGLNVLKDSGRATIAVLGDMGELGPTAAADHFVMGEVARELGIGRMLATGHLSVNTVRGFGAGAEHFDSRDAMTTTLIARLRDTTEPQVLLVKGSKFTGMNHVVSALEEQLPCS